jgi:hypothetical protein
MSSRILPMADLAQRSIMFWLPPGGRDNGVWASQWTLVAELDAADAPRVLSALAAADVGAYAAGAGASRRLYVDALQYNQALDAVMLFLRGRQVYDLGAYRSAPRAPHPAQAPTEPRRVVGRTLRPILAAAVLALLVAVVFVVLHLLDDRHRDVKEPASQHHSASSNQEFAVIATVVRA